MVKSASIYADHFHLKEDPFSPMPDPAFLFESKSYSRAIAWMNYAIEQREMGLVIGQAAPAKHVTVSTEPAPANGEKITMAIPQELVDEFINESSELLELMGSDFMSMEIEPENSEIVNTVFRAFHTLKGNSGLIGAEQLSELAHKAEDVLGNIRDKKLTPDSHIVDVLLLVIDKAKEFVELIRNDDLQIIDISTHLEKLGEILGDSPHPAPHPATKPAPATAQEKKTSLPPTANSSNRESINKKQKTIRVDVDRVDKLLNLVGELVLGKNRLLQINRQLNEKYNGVREIEDLDGVNNSMGHITTELQEGIMKVRMLPVANVFRKFPRLVRDLAKDNNKDIELTIKGEETEMDRSVIEAIGDPLVHLLRNAVDHGIETPEQRRKNGKPEKGAVLLDAYQEGNHIVIKIADDGAGINPEKIGRKAVEKGVLRENELAALTDKEIVNLIFKPGFSTAEKVTDVSGRGVGMDVVHSNISKLNGTVEIETMVGEGTAFIVKLPLTLTIMSGMVVDVSSEKYIIPLSNIAETLKYSAPMVSRVRGQEVLRLRDTVIPLLKLDSILGVPESEEITAVHEKYIVVVMVAEKHVGLVVSGLLGQEETVAKSLGQTLGKVLHLTGATIRGDGRVNLILDIPELVETSLNQVRND